MEGQYSKDNLSRVAGSHQSLVIIVTPNQQALDATSATIMGARGAMLGPRGQKQNIVLSWFHRQKY